jgi:hypothetical protein
LLLCGLLDSPKSILRVDAVCLAGRFESKDFIREEGRDLGKTLEQVHRMAGALAEQTGDHWGIALPAANDQDRSIVLARGIESDSIREWQRSQLHAAQERSSLRVCRETATFNWPVNSWTRPAQEIAIMEEIEYERDEYGVPLADRNLKSKVLRRWIQRTDLLDTRMEWEAVSANIRYGSTSLEAEAQAQANLFKRLDDKQQRQWVFNGWFAEESSRSRCLYLIRKGKPTVALGSNNRILCCLCIHPMGYYMNTYSGVMPPSDEALAVLLLIRSDEHRLWKKSGQHTALDPRSGL